MPDVRSYFVQLGIANHWSCRQGAEVSDALLSGGPKMQIVKDRPWLVRQAALLHRRLKYGLAAPVMGWLIRYTSLLDGNGEPPRAINYSAAGDFISQGDEIINRLHEDFDLTNERRNS
jgi:hypothetical protein